MKEAFAEFDNFKIESVLTGDDYFTTETKMRIAIAKEAHLTEKNITLC